MSDHTPSHDSSPHDPSPPGTALRDTTLHDLGWDESWDALAADHAPDPTRARPARVTLQGRDLWRVHDGEREHALADPRRPVS